MKMQEQELEALWKEWYPRVYGYFYKRVNYPDVVEELAAQTMTAAFLKLDSISNFQAYTWKCAHNYLVRYIKNKDTTPTFISIDGVDDDSFAIESDIELQESAEYREFRDKVMKCIDNHIPKPADKEILLLSIVEEKNSTEIGAELNVKPATVRKRVSRLITKLRERCLQIYKQN